MARAAGLAAVRAPSRRARAARLSGGHRAPRDAVPRAVVLPPVRGDAERAQTRRERRGARRRRGRVLRGSQTKKSVEDDERLGELSSRARARFDRDPSRVGRVAARLVVGVRRAVKAHRRVHAVAVQGSGGDRARSARVARENRAPGGARARPETRGVLPETVHRELPGALDAPAALVLKEPSRARRGVHRHRRRRRRARRRRRGRGVRRRRERERERERRRQPRRARRNFSEVRVGERVRLSGRVAEERDESGRERRCVSFRRRPVEPERERERVEVQGDGFRDRSRAGCVPAIGLAFSGLGARPRRERS